MNKFKWLKLETVIKMYSLVCKNSEDSVNELNSSKLNSTLQEIQDKFSSSNDKFDTIDISVSYLSKIIQNRPFEIENKKMAIACCELFLTLNGQSEIVAVDNDMLEIMIDVTEDGMDNNQIAELIREELR